MIFLPIGANVESKVREKYIVLKFLL
jgi:hypothetical protein